MAGLAKVMVERRGEKGHGSFAIQTTEAVAGSPGAQKSEHPFLFLFFVYALSQQTHAVI